LPLGKPLISVSGLPVGCGYTANVRVNGVGVQPHTWPSKRISGTTHLGCLQFDTAGRPDPMYWKLSVVASLAQQSSGDSVTRAILIAYAIIKLIIKINKKIWNHN